MGHTGQSEAIHSGPRVGAVGLPLAVGRQVASFPFSGVVPINLDPPRAILVMAEGERPSSWTMKLGGIPCRPPSTINSKFEGRLGGWSGLSSVLHQDRRLTSVCFLGN